MTVLKTQTAQMQINSITTQVKAQIQMVPIQTNQHKCKQYNFNSKQYKHIPADLLHRSLPKLPCSFGQFFCCKQIPKVLCPHFSFYKPTHCKVAEFEDEHSNLIMAKLKVSDVTTNGISQKIKLAQKFNANFFIA